MEVESRHIYLTSEGHEFFSILGEEAFSLKDIVAGQAEATLFLDHSRPDLDGTSDFVRLYFKYV